MAGHLRKCFAYLQGHLLSPHAAAQAISDSHACLRLLTKFDSCCIPLVRLVKHCLDRSLEGPTTKCLGARMSSHLRIGVTIFNTPINQRPREYKDGRSLLDK